MSAAEPAKEAGTVAARRTLPLVGEVTEAVIGLVVSMVHGSVDEATDVLPAPSMTAPAATCSVTVPSALDPPRETVNVYGPAPLPTDALLLQVVDDPPTVTSPVVESKPVTGSLKVTEQLNDVIVVGVADGRQVKDDTDGAAVSITMSLLKPSDPGPPGVGSAVAYGVSFPAESVRCPLPWTARAPTEL